MDFSPGRQAIPAWAGYVYSTSPVQDKRGEQDRQAAVKQASKIFWCPNANSESLTVNRAETPKVAVSSPLLSNNSDNRSPRVISVMTASKLRRPLLVLVSTTSNPRPTTSSLPLPVRPICTYTTSHPVNTITLLSDVTRTKGVTAAEYQSLSLPTAEPWIEDTFSTHATTP